MEKENAEFEFAFRLFLADMALRFQERSGDEETVAFRKCVTWANTNATETKKVFLSWLTTATGNGLLDVRL